MSNTAETPNRRKIIHVDMDAFFASVEQRDNPELRGRPVAVGGDGERSVVAAASYEARKFGVRSAMPSIRAKKLCPEIIFVRPRFDTYRAVSRQIREVFLEHTELVEPLSLDEAYLDVTDDLLGIPTATKAAIRIKQEIKKRTELTASAGVSYNKFLAKMASDFRKPDGLYVITPEMGADFVASLDIGKFHGVGPATEKKMREMGINTGLDLRQVPMEVLTARFGKAGTYFYSIARGIDHRPVNPDRPRKSVGAENTFGRDKTSYGELRDEILPLANKVWEHCRRLDTFGRTVTLKVKFSDFRQITRSKTFSRHFSEEAEIAEAACELLEGILPAPLGIRLLGVSVSGFEIEERHRTEESPQLSLF